LLDNTAEVAEQ